MVSVRIPYSSDNLLDFNKNRQSKMDVLLGADRFSLLCDIWQIFKIRFRKGTVLYVLQKLFDDWTAMFCNRSFDRTKRMETCPQEEKLGKSSVDCIDGIGSGNTLGRTEFFEDTQGICLFKQFYFQYLFRNDSFAFCAAISGEQAVGAEDGISRKKVLYANLCIPSVRKAMCGLCI